MKQFFIALFLGLITGIGGFCYVESRYHGIHNENLVNDTISIRDTIEIRDTVSKTPKIVYINIDSVRIDTINTVINGKVTDSKLCIEFK